MNRFLALLILILGLPLSGHAQILHLEIGAANYSPVPGISANAKAKRYEALTKTVNKLIHQFGPHGTIYLNDIDTSGLALACDYIREQLIASGYPDIQVKAIPGDYRAPDANLPKVKTLYINNADNRLLAIFPDDIQSSALSEWPYPGRASLTRAEYNNLAAVDLQRLGSLSETGLRISTNFDPEMSRLQRRIPAENFLQVEGLVGLPYYFWDGRLGVGPVNKVYLITTSAEARAKGLALLCEGKFF